MSAKKPAILALVCAYAICFGHVSCIIGFGEPKVVNVTYNVTSAVFLNVSIPGMQTEARIVIGLFDTVTPNTTENFRSLCTGKSGTGMCYNGSIFHRTIPGFVIQGGDYEKGDGTGGKSIYKDIDGKYSVFDDENFIIEHSDEGFVSMANSGANTNGAQFFITVEPAHWLDGLHVVFGKVLEGMEYVRKISLVSTDSNHRPREDIVIKGCGKWKLEGSVPVVSTKTTFPEHAEL